MADLPPFNYLASASQPLPNVYPTDNYQAASNALAMTPQEQAFYLRHLQNLYGSGGVDNPDGSRSTLYQIGVTGPGDRQYNVPTVWNGETINPDAPGGMDRIRANVLAAGGINAFPSYGSPFEAENRYQRMHDYMDRDTGAYLRSVGR